MQSVVTFGESSCCTFQLLLAFVEYHILALETVQRIKVLNQLMKLDFHSTFKPKIWFHYHFPSKEFLFQSCVQRKKTTEKQYNLQYWANKLCYTMRCKELDSQNLNVCTNTHSHICYTRIQPTKKKIIKIAPIIQKNLADSMYHHWQQWNHPVMATTPPSRSIFFL